MDWTRLDIQGCVKPHSKIKFKRKINFSGNGIGILNAMKDIPDKEIYDAMGDIVYLVRGHGLNSATCYVVSELADSDVHPRLLAAAFTFQLTTQLEELVTATMMDTLTDLMGAGSDGITGKS